MFWAWGLSELEAQVGEGFWWTHGRLLGDLFCGRGLQELRGRRGAVIVWGSNASMLATSTLPLGP